MQQATAGTGRESTNNGQDYTPARRLQVTTARTGGDVARFGRPSTPSTFGGSGFGVQSAQPVASGSGQRTEAENRGSRWPAQSTMVVPAAHSATVSPPTRWNGPSYFRPPEHNPASTSATSAAVVNKAPNAVPKPISIPPAPSTSTILPKPPSVPASIPNPASSSASASKSMAAPIHASTSSNTDTPNRTLTNQTLVDYNYWHKQQREKKRKRAEEAQVELEQGGTAQKAIEVGDGKKDGSWKRPRLEEPENATVTTRTFKAPSGSTTTETMQRSTSRSGSVTITTPFEAPAKSSQRTIYTSAIAHPPSDQQQPVRNNAVAPPSNAIHRPSCSNPPPASNNTSIESTSIKMNEIWKHIRQISVLPPAQAGSTAATLSNIYSGETDAQYFAYRVIEILARRDRGEEIITLEELFLGRLEALCKKKGAPPLHGNMLSTVVATMRSRPGWPAPAPPVQPPIAPSRIATSDEPEVINRPKTSKPAENILALLRQKAALKAKSVSVEPAALASPPSNAVASSSRTDRSPSTQCVVINGNLYRSTANAIVGTNSEATEDVNGDTDGFATIESMENFSPLAENIVEPSMKMVDVAPQLANMAAAGTTTAIDEPASGNPSGGSPVSTPTALPATNAMDTDVEMTDVTEVPTVEPETVAASFIPAPSASAQEVASSETNHSIAEDATVFHTAGLIGSASEIAQLLASADAMLDIDEPSLEDTLTAEQTRLSSPQRSPGPSSPAAHSPREAISMEEIAIPTPAIEIPLGVPTISEPVAFFAEASGSRLPPSASPTPTPAPNPTERPESAAKSGPRGVVIMKTLRSLPKNRMYVEIPG